MVRFTHIPYPTDLSDAAAPGLGYALSLARWYQARLTVLHVVPTFEAVPMPPGAIGELTHMRYPPSRDAVLAEIRRALGTAIYGSTTHEVIRAATCPVLVVRG
ncbi:MAG: universal stress protein [Acidimicrobiia bacterium]|nr:universal stress protein [Acidimicrobiia bacterium]